MQNALQEVKGSFSKEDIDVVKNTVAKGATDTELKMFLYIARRYGLDPFLKEIWFYKRPNKNGGHDTVIQTSRDGLLSIAMRDPNYRGFIGGVVREGDIFEFNADQGTIKHRFGVKRGKILGAWATAYHAKRMPVSCFVDFDEYRQETLSWRKYPSAMIQKVAEAFVLRRQFNIHGLYIPEEMSMNDTQEEYSAINMLPQNQAEDEETGDRPNADEDIELMPEGNEEDQEKAEDADNIEKQGGEALKNEAADKNSKHNEPENDQKEKSEGIGRPLSSSVKAIGGRVLVKEIVEFGPENNELTVLAVVTGPKGDAAVVARGINGERLMDLVGKEVYVVLSQQNMIYKGRKVLPVEKVTYSSKLALVKTKVVVKDGTVYLCGKQGLVEARAYDSRTEKALYELNGRMAELRIGSVDDKFAVDSAKEIVEEKAVEAAS